MNYLLVKSHFTSSLLPRLESNSLSEKLANAVERFFYLFLGICSVAIALPLLVLAIIFSVFLPQEKWEEFWDEFLEA